MREIKFRAWDKKHKRMWSMADIDSEHSIADFAYEMNGDSYEKLGGLNPDEDLIPMQYTGLKDKNGVEIYEADVVYFSNGRGDGHSPQNVEVKFNEGGFYPFAIGHEIPEYNDLDKPHDAEVIGNVWENPELIEDKNNEEQ